MSASLALDNYAKSDKPKPSRFSLITLATVGIGFYRHSDIDRVMNGYFVDLLDGLYSAEKTASLLGDVRTGLAPEPTQPGVPAEQDFRVT
jgi:hypothetical protein